MAKDIKIKEKIIENKTKKGSVGKVADRAKIISAKARAGVIKAKDKVQENTTADDRFPEKYAVDEVTEGIHKAAADTEIVADNAVRSGVRKIKKKLKQKKSKKQIMLMMNHRKSLNSRKSLKIKKTLRKTSQIISSPTKNNRKIKNCLRISRKKQKQNRIRLPLTVNLSQRKSARIQKRHSPMFSKSRGKPLTKRKNRNSESRHRRKQGVSFLSKSRKPNINL